MILDAILALALLVCAKFLVVDTIAMIRELREKREKRMRNTSESCTETTRDGRNCSRPAKHFYSFGRFCTQHAPCVCDEGCDYEPNPECVQHGERGRS